jgi:hypothetical protein
MKRYKIQITDKALSDMEENHNFKVLYIQA